MVWNTTIDGNHCACFPSQANDDIHIYYIWWWWAMPPVVYITHLYHSARTSTKHCIDNKSNAEESKFFLQNLMTAPPKMYWRVTNYHWVESTISDESDYKQVTSIKTARVEVTSHVDKSNVNVDLTAYPITQLSLSKVSACVSCAPVHAVSGPDRVCAYLKPDVNCAGIYLCCRGSIRQTDVLRRILQTEQDR